MSLIQRQNALVAKLEDLYRKHFSRGYAGFGQDICGLRAKFKRQHVEEMLAAGYTRKEAMESAEQCNDVAYRNADSEAFMNQMGAAA